MMHGMNRRLDSKRDLDSELTAYISHWNGQARPFDCAYGENSGMWLLLMCGARPDIHRSTLGEDD